MSLIGLVDDWIRKQQQGDARSNVDTLSSSGGQSAQESSAPPDQRGSDHRATPPIHVDSRMPDGVVGLGDAFFYFGHDYGAHHYYCAIVKDGTSDVCTCGFVEAWDKAQAELASLVARSIA